MKNLNLVITPKLLNEWVACQDGKVWGLSAIGDGIALKKLLPLFERADWMLWTLNKAEALDEIQFVQCAIICAKEVLEIFEKKYPNDKRPRKAIDAAVKYVKNPSGENRIAAAYAANSAADAANSAADAAADSAYSAHAAAYSAAYSAAYATNAAADAANSAVDSAAEASARKETHKKLCKKILKFLGVK